MSMPGRWAGLELRHLLALEAVAEHRSFHRAAASLSYTQSGVSQQIASLERIVGEKLVERPGGSRPVHLTEAGEIVLRHTRSMFHAITAAQADVTALKNGNGGVLRVGSFQSVSATLVPELMRRLPRERPGMSIELVQTTTDLELFPLLEAGRLDITFAMLPLPDGPFDALELFSDPLVVMAAADSPLAARAEPVSMRELCHLPLIASRECPQISRLETRIRERGHEPNVVHRSDDNGTIQGLVAAGEGVAVVGRLAAEAAGPEITVLDLDEQLPPRRVALSWRHDRQQPRRHDAFIELTRRACTALGLEVAEAERSAA